MIKYVQILQIKIGVAIMTDNDSSNNIEPPELNISTSSLYQNTNQNSQLVQTQSNKNAKQAIGQLNQKGIVSIRQGNYQEGLKIFQECNKMMSSASAQGIRIENQENIIVLINQTVCYQHLQMHDKAAQMVQTVLQYLENGFRSEDSVNILNKMGQFFEKKVSDAQISPFFTSNFQNIQQLIEQKWQAAQYYLQYSGLTSQNQQHHLSLTNAQKSLATAKEVCHLCYKYHLISPKNYGHGKIVLKELSNLPIQFVNVKGLEEMREEFRRLSLNTPDNNQLYYQSYQILSEEHQKFIQNADIHSIFDVMPLSSQSKNQEGKFEIAYSYFHHLKKILFMIGAYFAMAVQVLELQTVENHYYQNLNLTYQEQKSKQNTAQAEMAFLSSLILSYKYIPSKTALKTYLHDFYNENYLHIKKKSEVSGQPVDLLEDRGNEGCYQQENKEGAEMNVHIELLQEKYKDYLIEKDVSVQMKEGRQEQRSESQSYRSVEKKGWQQQKKQSKRLAELFKQESGTFLKVPQQNKYLNDVASIDSYEIGTSSIQPTLHLTKSHDGKFIKSKSKSKHRDNIKTFKTITQYSSVREAGLSSKNNAKLEALRNQNEQLKKMIKNKKNQQKNRKSKSMKNIKSKSKDAKIVTQKRTAPMQNNIPQIPNEKSLKKRKSIQKQKNKTYTGGFDQEVIKLATSQKKLMTISSQQFLNKKQFTPMSSVKDQLGSLKFNKIRSPLKMPKSPEVNTHRPAVIQYVNPSQKPPKSNSKNKSVSINPKKASAKNKSLSTKKSPAKKQQPKSDAKIYTSAKIYKSANINMKKR